MKNKIKILGITAFLSTALIAGLAGCASYYQHYQTVKNGTDDDIREVYYRDTGTADWLRVDKVRSAGWIDSDSGMLRGSDEYIIFTAPVSSDKTTPPPDTPNKDIRIIDARGLIYTKLNVPIAYNRTMIQAVIGGKVSTVSRSGTIIFTDQDRHPFLAMKNETGLPIRITAPVNQPVANSAVAYWSLPELSDNRNITVNYSVNDYTFTKNAELNADVTLPLTEKPPAVTVINNTGYPVMVSSPFTGALANEDRSVYLKPSRTANLIQVTYSIGSATNNFTYSEQVTINNEDVTLTLTKRPPTLTIANNVGVTINFIWLRIPGSPSWEGGNIVIRGGTVHLGAGAGAQTGDISGSIVNRDSMKLWLGNVNLSGNVFDIRIDDVQGGSYVKSNVQITNDMTLTFTQSDKR